jgi:integrase
MALEIWKIRVRNALMPRDEPYWGPPLGKGKSLGFRQLDGAPPRWIAKLRDHTGHHKKSLGQITEDFNYDRAREAALSWFKSYESGITDESFTVESACKDYVDDRRIEKGEACAHDAEKRFERTVYGKPFGKMAVVKVWSADIKKWRRETDLSKSSQNRTMTSLRAALNLAVDNRKVTAARRIEWESVKQHKGVDKRRTLFLDLAQRRKLKEAAGESTGDLIAGIALTGARPGDLRTVRRSHYDSRTKSVNFGSKDAPRTVPLSKAGIELFDRLAKDKLPSAYLFTRDDGKPWAHSDWDELIRDAAKKAELPSGVCLYTLRHAFITQSLMDGMTTLDVARITGTSLAMIEKHYGHLVMDAARTRLELVNLL